MSSHSQLTIHERLRAAAGRTRPPALPEATASRVIAADDATADDTTPSTVATVSATPPLVVVPQPTGLGQARVIRLTHHYHENCLRLRFACSLRYIWERRLDDIERLDSIPFLRRSRNYNTDFERAQELLYTSNEDKIFRFIFVRKPELSRVISYLLDLKIQCELDTPEIRARPPWRDSEYPPGQWAPTGGSQSIVREEELRWVIVCTERELLGPEAGPRVLDPPPDRETVRAALVVLLRALIRDIGLWQHERTRLRRSCDNANVELTGHDPPTEPLLTVTELI